MRIVFEAVTVDAVEAARFARGGWRIRSLDRDRCHGWGRFHPAPEALRPICTRSAQAPPDLQKGVSEWRPLRHDSAIAH